MKTDQQQGRTRQCENCGERRWEFEACTHCGHKHWVKA